jgi:3-isopropylmalate/(R)-2-methylmalate dehydratase small subunit
MTTTLPKIEAVTGRAVPVLGDDIDTDRIIPACFMKCITFDGLGQYAFYDERFVQDGEPHPDFALNKPHFAGASILLTGENFGCGSSREHAPQSLYYFGFRAVVAVSYAEIFFGNATQIGIVCVTAKRAAIENIARMVADQPELALTIDLDAQTLRAGDESIPVELPAGTRRSLREGTWDPLAELLQGADSVDRQASGLPYMQSA